MFLSEFLNRPVFLKRLGDETATIVFAFIALVTYQFVFNIAERKSRNKT